MTELNLTPFLEKSCVVWSSRREQSLAVRVYYEAHEQDGCRIYTLHRYEEVK